VFVCVLYSDLDINDRLCHAERNQWDWVAWPHPWANRDILLTALLHSSWISHTNINRWITCLQ